jgi:hypothetical protein
MRRQPPPLQTKVTDARGLITNAWGSWFASLFDAKPMESSGDLVDIPTNLGKSDKGYLYTALDYSRVYRWNGTAWERADGQADPHRYIWADSDPGIGWHIADGSTVTQTKPDGTAETHPTINMVGYYVKGAGAAGAGVAATNPSATGSTNSVSAGVPAGSVTVGSSTGSTSIASGTGPAGTAAADGHGHSGNTFTGSALAPHSHNTVTITFTSAGEPQHVSLVPYYRL